MDSTEIALLASNFNPQENLRINNDMKDNLYKTFKNQVAVALGIPAAIGVWEIISFNQKNHASTRLLQFVKLGIFSLSLIYVSLQKKELMRKFTYIDLNYPYQSKAQIDYENEIQKYEVDQILRSDNLEEIEGAIKSLQGLDQEFESFTSNKNRKI